MKIELHRSFQKTNGEPLGIDSEYKENEAKMREDMMWDAAEMLEASGIKNKNHDNDCYPGMAIHEMGTARMGNDPKTSVLNKWNQMHEVSNVLLLMVLACLP
jgi:choline dehydrogenase-like flavoprotein